MFTLEESAAVAIWSKLCHRDPQGDAVRTNRRTSGASFFLPKIAQSAPKNHYFLDVSAFTLGVFLS